MSFSPHLFPAPPHFKKYVSSLKKWTKNLWSPDLSIWVYFLQEALKHPTTVFSMLKAEKYASFSILHLGLLSPQRSGVKSAPIIFSISLLIAPFQGDTVRKSEWEVWEEWGALPPSPGPGSPQGQLTSWTLSLSLHLSCHDQTCICSFLDPFIASMRLSLPPALNALLCSISLRHTAVKMTFQNHRSRCHLPRGAPSPAGEHLTSWGCPAGPLVNVNPPVFPRHGPPFPGLSPFLYSRDPELVLIIFSVWTRPSPLSLCCFLCLENLLPWGPSLSLFTCQCLLKLCPNLPLQSLDSLTCVMYPFIKVPTTLCWDDLQLVLPYQNMFPEGRESSLVSSVTLGPSSGSHLHTIC